MTTKFTECGSLLRLDNTHYLIGSGPRTWIDKSISSPCFYFPDFFLTDQQPWFYHEKTEILHVDQLLALLPKPKKMDPLCWTNPYKAHFHQTFSDLQNRFANNSLQKAVPYVFELSKDFFDQEHLSQALSKILTYSKNQPLHVYGFWDGNEGLLGASPEILFQYQRNEGSLLETIACAGTIDNAVDQEEFLHDAKAALEHQIVIDGISESLAHLGTVKKGERKVLKLPKLSHLITPIEVESYDPMDFISIAKALHPTPALGAYPREEGMRWLCDYQQKMERGRYGAPVGCLYDEGKKAKCIVAIRNIQWSRIGSKIGAGCGVVHSSSIEDEWNEICLKIESIKDLF